MIRRLDPTDAATATRIVEIQRSAYAIEAELMGFDGIPPMHETVLDVMALHDLEWHGAYESATLAGIIAWSQVDQTVEIDRLAIDPDWSRRGYGRALVRAVPCAEHIEVSTGTRNLPAVALYENEGFVFVGTTEIAPNVFTSQFRRSAAPTNEFEAAITNPGDSPQMRGCRGSSGETV